jgi:hypothetical protein
MKNICEPDKKKYRPFMQGLTGHLRLRILFRFALMLLIVRPMNSFVLFLSCYVQVVQEERPKRQRVFENCHSTSRLGIETW